MMRSSASLRTNIPYKQVDRIILATYADHAAHWRHDYSQSALALNKTLEQSKQRFQLLQQLTKIEKDLIFAFNTLSTLKDQEYNLDRKFSKVIDSLELLKSKKISQKEWLQIYDSVTNALQVHLKKTQELKELIKNYIETLMLLKNYLPATKLASYKASAQAIQQALINKATLMESISKEFVTHQDLLMQTKMTRTQTNKFIDFINSHREFYRKAANDFYDLVNQKKIKEIGVEPLALKKPSQSFNDALQKYLTTSEEVNLDQKFYRFIKKFQIIRENLIDLKDENTENEYLSSFDVLLDAIKSQRQNTAIFEKSSSRYLKELAPENKESYELHKRIHDSLQKQIEFLDEKIKQLRIGQNQKTMTDAQSIHQQMERWKQKLHRQIFKTDELVKKLKDRDTHFEELQKQLRAMHPSASLEHFPMMNKPHHQVKLLINSMQEYKKSYLNVLNKQLHYHAANWNLLLQQCQKDMNFNDKKKDFQKIVSSLAKVYETLKQSVLIEEQVDEFKHILNESRKLNEFNKELDLCDEMKKQITADIKYFSRCYQILTIESSLPYQKEQDRITRINHLLQNIYDHLGTIEKEFEKAGINAKGVTTFKEQFTSLLLYNTVHEEDLENTIKQYKKWLQQMEHIDVLYIDSTLFFKALQKCHKGFDQLQGELSTWRISTLSYISGTGLQIISPLVSMLFSFVIPGVIPDIISSSTFDMAEKVLKLGSQQVYSKVSETLSPTEREIEFEDFKEEKSKPLKKGNFKLAGTQRKVNSTKDSKLIAFSLDHLWREAWYASLVKAVYNKKMIITGISGSISLALAITGAGTLLAILLLIGGSASGGLSLSAYDEYQKRTRESEVRFAALKRLQEIDVELQLLTRVPVGHAFNKYYFDTMSFIQNILTYLQTYMKENENDDLMKAYISKMLNYLDQLPSANKTLVQNSIPENLELKQSHLRPLFDFLENETLKEKDNFITTIQCLNQPTLDEETMENKKIIARQYVHKLEEILKTLHDECGVGGSPLQKSIKLIEIQLKQSSHDRFFKPGLSAIEKEIYALLPRKEDLNNHKKPKIE